MSGTQDCFTTFANTSKFVKNTLLRAVFSVLFSVLGKVDKEVFRACYSSRAIPRRDRLCLCLLQWLSIRSFSKLATSSQVNELHSVLMYGLPYETCITGDHSIPSGQMTVFLECSERLRSLFRLIIR